jgi:tetratricopeptide (TPR) repeat protein
MNKEDYEEPLCPFTRPDSGGTCSCSGCRSKINLPEVIAKCDELFNAEKTAELGEHLRKWRSEAQQCGDKSAELSLLSELMGHYRMSGERENALSAVQDGLSLLSELKIGGSVSAGTILLNAATALKEFGELDRALRCYEEASRCYSGNLAADDWRFAGLFNNMASAYQEKGELRQAEIYYQQALKILRKQNNLMDTAVTQVNLAGLYRRMNKSEAEIDQCLDLAMACFDAPEAEYNGYYAHTCRKCASAFGDFGRKEDEAELNARADVLYESD